VNNLKYPDLGKFLVNKNAKFIGVYRDNAFDHHVCKIRECFSDKEDGYVLDMDTKRKNTMCFERRKQDKSSNTKVYINPKNIEEKLKKIHSKPRQYTEYMNKIGIKANIFKLTDLSAFMYNNSNRSLRKSVHAWNQVFQNFGFHLSKREKEKIHYVLQQGQNTRKQKKYEDSILNFHEISHLIHKKTL